VAQHCTHRLAFLFPSLKFRFCFSFSYKERGNFQISTAAGPNSQTIFTGASFQETLFLEYLSNRAVSGL
jgi:hypothetical protein